MPINVVTTFPIGPELAESIRAVSPDLRVTVLGEQLLAELRRATRYPSQRQAAVPSEELCDAIASAEVLFSFWGGALPDLVDEGRGTPHLRWVQLSSAGADRVEPDLIRSGITFTTVSGLHATPIAEFVITYILMLSKGWPELWRAQRTHEFARAIMPTEIAGQTVGIVGMGAIGAETARLARGLGCRVLGMRRSFSERGPDEVADEGIPVSQLHDLLRESDYVVIAAPLTPETQGMIGAAELRAMGSGAYLINIARGQLVDEGTLVEALKDGTIAGAALDVFDREPLPEASELWDLPNVIVTPHISGGVPDYDARATEIFCDNLRRYLAGKPLRNVVDADLRY